MSKSWAGGSTTAWRRTRAAILTNAARRGDPCAICGQPIDYTLDGRHPNGPQVDHAIPLSIGGHHARLRPAHAHCNQSRGNRPDPDPTPARGTPW